VIATLKVPLTGGDNRWAMVSSNMLKTTGLHDIFFIFKGQAETDIAFLDYWMFTK
ncbi:MAG: carbohydrate-binding protein, partial [Chryseobacterium sp.]